MSSRRATALPAVALAVMLASDRAAAQSSPFDIPPGPQRIDVSGFSGLMLSTDWSDLVLLGSVSAVSGAFEQVLLRDLVVEPGPVFNAVVTYWEGRYGFRAHGGFSRSCLAVGRRCGTPAAGPGNVDVDTWMYDIGGAIGLVDYRPGRIVWPYVFFGVGGVTYDLEGTVSPPLTFIERRPVPSGDRQLIVSRDDPDPLLIAIDELGLETRFAVNLGIGTDFRVPLGPASLGVRLEVSDHVHRSPLDIRIHHTEAFLAVPDARVDFGLVHNLRAAAGVVVQIGR